MKQQIKMAVIIIKSKLQKLQTAQTIKTKKKTNQKQKSLIKRNRGIDEKKII